MSTRSLVGGLTDSGTYVVYVHFDGYPEGRLPVLDELIKRDGAAKAVRPTEQPVGWRII